VTPNPKTPCWYFACRHCTSKWFAVRCSCRCPRCGKRARSETKLVPPWQGKAYEEVAALENTRSETRARKPVDP
jgi:hypothetical protein